MIWLTIPAGRYSCPMTLVPVGYHGEMPTASSPAASSTAPSSTMERLLDAFEELLIDGGERSATLGAVAAAAGVSKGGPVPVVSWR